MKLRISLLVVLLVLLSAVTVEAQTSIITDGGFESGNLSAWSTQAATIGTAYARTGNFGVRLSGNGAMIAQDIAPRLTAGVNQTFVAYVQIATRGTSWGSVWFRLDQYPDCGAGSYGTAQAINDVASGWQMLTLQRTFTAAQLASPVYLCVIGFGFAGGAANVDDIGIGGTPITPTNTRTATATATRTNTAIPPSPTNTRTPTNTPQPPTPTNTATITPTLTTVPPTSTYTPTATRTNTPTIAPPTSTNTPTPTATAPSGTVTPTPRFEVDIYDYPRAGEVASTMLTLSRPVPLAIQQCTTVGGASCATYATHHYHIVVEPNMWYRYQSPSGVVLEFFIPPGTQYLYRVLPE